jgi:hypothetical protein
VVTITVDQRVALAFALLCSACGSPMAYPRTADLHRGLSGGVRTNMSYGDARVTYSRPPNAGSNPDEPPKPERIVAEENASSSVQSAPFATQLLGLPLDVEGGFAHGFSESVALGGWASLELIGAELRLQALRQSHGAPLSATFALGVAHVGLAPSFERRMLEQGFGTRAGIDLSLSGNSVEALLGVYASFIRRRRNFPISPSDAEEWFESSLMVVRDELKVSVPLGVAALTRGSSGAIVIGVVPEWTLASSLRDARCACDDGYSLTEFRQVFTIYLTIGFEGWHSESVAKSPRTQ